ncbi:MAG: efflux RND transporter permease subunit, partial [Aureliella sp.]
MLDSIIRLSLRYRMLVVVVSLFVLVYGSYLATQMSIDVFPDLDRPRVVIITEAPGLATEEVETLVTQPIEIALMGAHGVQAVRSQSTAGLNVIYIEFDWSTEIRAARQTVQERLSTLEGILPDGIRPQMTPPSSIMGQIIVAGIYRQNGPSGGRLAQVGNTEFMAEIVVDETSNFEIVVWSPGDRHELSTWKKVDPQETKWTVDDSKSSLRTGTASIKIDGKLHDAHFFSNAKQQLELRTIADWIIRPRLLKTTGVAEVFMLGGDRKQYQILIDPTALLEYDVTVQDVEQALRASNINTSGGFAVTGETERPIRVLGRLGPQSQIVIEDLKKVPVGSHTKRSVLLEQVARVTEGPQFKRGDGSVDGRPGIVFTTVKQPHIDTRELSDAVAEAFTEVEASLPADIIVNSELFRLRNFIDRGIFNVAEALVIGAVLVVIVLFLFLLNFRTTFITLTAIPLSLVLTTLTFRIMGWLSGTELSINVMTLGGIAVAMGELVDDAIVDVENIFRRLKLNNLQPIENRRPSIVVTFEASKEIRSSIVFGTTVVILSFMPLFALSGVEGRLFTPLGVAYIVSILSSFVVSMTVTPVLAYYLLPNSRATHNEGDGFL